MKVCAVSVVGSHHSQRCGKIKPKRKRRFNKLSTAPPKALSVPGKLAHAYSAIVNGRNALQIVLTLYQVIKLSAIFCPIWFVANYTYNLGLALTSVSSNTISLILHTMLVLHDVYYSKSNTAPYNITLMLLTLCEHIEHTIWVFCIGNKCIFKSWYLQHMEIISSRSHVCWLLRGLWLVLFLLL